MSNVSGHTASTSSKSRRSDPKGIIIPRSHPCMVVDLCVVCNLQVTRRDRSKLLSQQQVIHVVCMYVRQSVKIKVRLYMLLNAVSFNLQKPVISHSQVVKKFLLGKTPKNVFGDFSPEIFQAFHGHQHSARVHTPLDKP